MQTVIETPHFIKSARECGLTQLQIDEIIDMVADDPECGDEMKDTGGFRKVRVAGRGKGKSGGYRLVTFFSGPTIPVFLIDIYSKGDKDNLSKAERNTLKTVSKQIIAAYRKPATKRRSVR